MSAGGWMMAVAIVLAVASLVFLIVSMVRSIQKERTPGRSVWREFTLGLALMLMFFSTWFAHLVSEWQVYTDDQRELGQSTQIGDFLSRFSQSTLENWQSEFLQLFSFVVLAALFIHKGSGESKDGTDKLEASLRRIEEHLGTLPDTSDVSEPWQLPETAMENAEAHDARRARRHAQAAS